MSSIAISILKKNTGHMDKFLLMVAGIETRTFKLHIIMTQLFLIQLFLIFGIF